MDTGKILFNADAEQRVPLSIKKGNKRFEVAHKFRAPSDEEILEYERRRNVRVREARPEELDEDAVLSKDDSFDAAVWLWNKLAESREGYIAREDWKDSTNANDKVTAITEGLLATEVVPPGDDVLSEELLSDEELSSVTLRCLFDGKAVDTVHHLRAPNAADMRSYRSLMSQNFIVRGSRFRTAETRIPPRAKKLAELYDSLLETFDGYIGRVPVHHKMAVALELFGQQSRALEKN